MPGGIIAVITTTLLEYTVVKAVALVSATSLVTGASPKATTAFATRNGRKRTRSSSFVPALKRCPAGKANAKPTLPAPAAFVLVNSAAPKAFVPGAALTNANSLVAKFRLNPTAFSSPCAASKTVSVVSTPTALVSPRRKSVRVAAAAGRANPASNKASTAPHAARA